MKNRCISMLLLFTSMLFGCEDEVVKPDFDMVPDTISPTVDIVTPVSTDSFHMFGKINLQAHISDNIGLISVRVLAFKQDNPRDVVELTQISSKDINWNRDYTLNTSITNSDLRLPKDKDESKLFMIVEAVDRWDNITKQTVTVTVHASAINMEDFANAFQNKGLFEYFSWWGLQIKNGTSVDKVGLNYVLYLLADTNVDSIVSAKEWDVFTANFHLKNLSREAWDLNGDNNLVRDEFIEGISKMNTFAELDTNKDALITEQEMAKGIFRIWDQNKDDLLSRDECEDRFYTYFSS